MKTFSEWLKFSEKHGKLIAVRKWMWNQEHGNESHKKAPSPLHQGDPDFEEIDKKARSLGPLDPYRIL